ncbi:hypothetical protein GETHOR_22160 [Geothrix oryzae]|uniref:Uncharacterized protein n=1 Tax=Geothrix oryzae TaxID=2927975 RepID=A0ABN6V8I1_9BACT|nr:hypothetical protein [Geothrix oryzae]BDU70115.1 hypothetical protein GETHOR_22160 [Geothrix oryzae]
MRHPFLTALSVAPLAALVACVTPAHTPTYPRGYPGLKGVMNHLPDGRWQFVLELPNPDRRRTYRLETEERLEVRLDLDSPKSWATWTVDAARVENGKSFQMKLWVDGDDFPLNVAYPKGGRDYGREGASALIYLSILPRH